MLTCMCGRVLETMCAPCSALSYTIEAARRRADLRARLEIDGSDLARLGVHPINAYDVWEGAEAVVLRSLVEIEVLRHRQWGTRGEPLHPQTDGLEAKAGALAWKREPMDLIDEDWFVTSPAHFAQVFELIEDEYALRLAALTEGKKHVRACA